MSKLYIPGQGWGGGGGSSAALTFSAVASTATGTPSASTYLRGDGTWATPTGDSSVLGETTLGSDDTTISVTLSEAIGDDEYITLAYNFVCTAVNQDIKLFLNGETSETGYTVNGTPNTAKLYTSANDSVRYGSLNVVPIPYAGNLFVEATGVIWDSGATRYSRQLTGLGGITSIQLVTTGQFKAGSNLKVMRLSGAGVQGATGPTGPAGEGAVPWQTATQGSNGNTLTLTLGTTGDVFEVMGQITSQSASSATEIEFNGSVGGHAYRHHFSTGADANAGGYFPPGTVGSGVTCYFHGYVQRTGELIHADLNVSLPASALSHSVVYKTITGATTINALRVFSNQANGIGAGSFISARKVK